MADKQRVKKNLNRLNRIRTWQLLIVLVLFGFVAATFLRMNNVGMVDRRAGVLSADREGDDAKTSDRLSDLQRFSSSRMNASTGVFYLTEAYNREVKRRVDAASQNTGLSTENILAKANEVCRARHSHTTTAYMFCVRDEQAKYPPSEISSSKAELPNKGLYRYEFTSPLWTPDFAGMSLLICALILLVIITRGLTVVVLRAMLKRQYRDI